MNDLHTNAKRMIGLFERMRSARSSPAFNLLKELNLSFSHMGVIRCLAEHGEMTMKQIAECLQITPPSVTVLVRRLEQTKMVQRRANDNDSRVTLLSLAPQGQQFHSQFVEEHLTSMTRLLKGLTPDEQEEFLNLLERAVEAMISDE
ncbi:MAG: MarR family transcriptional regulator [Herpetosiphon sp.]|nr:MarR family transcriptional regulator [Herpetosiphon sp.]